MDRQAQDREERGRQSSPGCCDLVQKPYKVPPQYLKLLFWQLKKSLSGFTVHLSQKAIIFFLEQDIICFLSQFSVLVWFNCAKLCCSQNSLGNIVDFWQSCQKTIFDVKIKTQPERKEGAVKRRDVETRGEEDRGDCLKETFWWMSRVLGQWQYN